MSSNLVKHARRELELIGEDPETINGMLRVVGAFAAMHPSGGQAAVCIPVLNELLQFNNLAPLTNDPKEWNQVDDNLWQSQRNSEAFSIDGGQTYYLLSEREKEIIHETIDKDEFAAYLAARKEDED